MSNNEASEEFMLRWSSTDLLVNMFFSTMFYTLGYLLALSLIGYYNLYGIFTLIIISISFVGFRNVIVSFLFNHIPILTYMYIINLLYKITQGLMLLVSLTFIDEFFNNVIFSNIPNITLISFSILLLYVPFQYVFTDSFSSAGEIKVEFLEFNNNFSVFHKRQSWMKKILKRVVNKLKLGNIDVDYESLIYHFNLKIMASEEIMRDHFETIEQWLYSNGNDEAFMNSLKDIISTDEISPLKKRPITTYFNWISPEYMKLIFLLLFLVYVALYRPDWIGMVISKLIE